ncbi:MAG: hypothetical protein R3D85_00385 [Paracoccaceae bacterium]
MGMISFLLIWLLAPVVVVTGAVHALIFALRPLLVRFLPDDMFGPGGMYIDTAQGLGIFDRHPRRG